MRFGRLAALAGLLISATALAEEPRDASPAPVPSSLAASAPTAPATVRPIDPVRRAEQAAEEARSRVTAFRAVARLARAQVKTLRGQERLDAERGLGQLDEQIASLEASITGARKAAIDAADPCFLPFTIDPHGRKMWKEECL